MKAKTLFWIGYGIWVIVTIAFLSIMNLINIGDFNRIVLMLIHIIASGAVMVATYAGIKARDNNV